MLTSFLITYRGPALPKMKTGVTTADDDRRNSSACRGNPKRRISSIHMYCKHVGSGHFVLLLLRVAQWFGRGRRPPRLPISSRPCRATVATSGVVDTLSCKVGVREDKRRDGLRGVDSENIIFSVCLRLLRCSLCR